MVAGEAAVILTIGNELLAGDIDNTNASWLARRLERLGVPVGLIAILPDEISRIAPFLRSAAAAARLVVVTGGLGGTPDDLTREAVAAAFGVGQTEDPGQASRLRERFVRDPDYAVRWAQLPTGSRALENPLGGAPGFVLENVYVLPGLPREMEAMFGVLETEFAGAPPIASWRRRYRTNESRIVAVLEMAEHRHPGIRFGSYPSFDAGGSEVEIVAKSSDAAGLAAAVAWLGPALDDAAGSD